MSEQHHDQGRYWEHASPALVWMGDEGSGFFAQAGRTLYSICNIGEHLSHPYEVRTITVPASTDPAALIAEHRRLNSQLGDRIDDPIRPPSGNYRTYAKPTATLDEAMALAQADYDKTRRLIPLTPLRGAC